MHLTSDVRIARLARIYFIRSPVNSGVRPLRMLNAPWHGVTLERVASGKLAARGHDVLRILSERAIREPSSSRLRRAVELMDHVNRDAAAFETLSDEDAERLLEGTRTVFEAFLVTWALIERKRSSSPFNLQTLDAFHLGADLARAESNATPRNIQFELVAGAHLVLGGADIRPQEPDYRLLYHGAYVGIAVKRLTSTNTNTLCTRLREAVSQIESSTGVGFVAVNLDNWITDLASGTPDEVGRHFQQQLIDAHREVVNLADRKATLLGALIFGTWLRWLMQDGRRSLDWRNVFQFVGFVDSAAERQRFDEYFGPLRDRWANSVGELGVLITAAA